MSNNKTKSEKPKPKNGGSMELYSKFLEWHVGNFGPCMGERYDYMEFPIAWDRSRPLIEHLYYIYKAYCKELKDFSNIDEVVQEECKTICENILWIIARAMNLISKDNKNNETIKSKFDEIFNKLKPYGWEERFIELAGNKGDSGNSSKTLTLYKLRQEKHLFAHNDFYHVPFDKLYLSNTERFSAMGYPCLYLGYSAEDCLFELEKKKGTIAEMKLNGKLMILDLTLPPLGTQRKINDMFLLWPLLAACYVAPPRSLHANFKEEYVFPQQLTRYLLEKETVNGKEVNGIRYYSCRKKDLDPQKEDYMNLVLFTNMDKKKNRKKPLQNENTICSPVDFSILSNRYDMNLMNKFEITKIYTVDYEKSES